MLPSFNAPWRINNMARETVAEVPFQAGLSGAASGLHRRQGRKPASAAAAAEGKWTMFSGLGERAGHMGRQ
jgi:hypothetical protein